MRYRSSDDSGSTSSRQSPLGRPAGVGALWLREPRPDGHSHGFGGYDDDARELANYAASPDELHAKVRAVSDARSDIIELSDYVYQRTRNRLAGLTDDEYFWEPVPRCWTIRQEDSGEYCADYDGESETPPFTGGAVVRAGGDLVGTPGLFRSLGSKFDEADALTELGTALRLTGDYEAALAHEREGLRCGGSSATGSVRPGRLTSSAWCISKQAV